MSKMSKKKSKYSGKKNIRKGNYIYIYRESTFRHSDIGSHSDSKSDIGSHSDSKLELQYSNSKLYYSTPFSVGVDKNK
jgi:hypothetical protein